MTNTVIILTSNVGAQSLLGVGDKAEIPTEIRNDVLAQVRQHFRPEFLNR